MLAKVVTIGVGGVRMVHCHVIVGGGVLLMLRPTALHFPVANVLAMECPDGVVCRFLGPESINRQLGAGPSLILSTVQAPLQRMIKNLSPTLPTCCARLPYRSTAVMMLACTNSSFTGKQKSND